MTSNKYAGKILIAGVILITLTLLASVFILPLSDLSHQSNAPAKINSVASRHSDLSASLSSGVMGPTLNPSAPSPGMQVDPTSFYSSEPAPMGIADYGLGSKSLGVYTSSYFYYTPSFLGTINLDNLTAANASNSQSVTFQLNVVMYFVSGGSDYSYWIQDVVHLNTTTNVAYFEDNVWNYSATSSQLMYPSSISGGGVVQNLSTTQSFYYDYASSSLPGNFVALNEPSTIEMMVNSTITQSGLPGVSFMYNDGQGWVTYDNVVFPFATAMTADDGFVVDGAVNTPSSNYYDAELILGGNGGGATTQVYSSNVNLTLQYWNGNNFQATPGAFNYGSNTAETVSNIVSNSYYYTSDGSLFEEMTSGSGTLGQMYNPSNIASLNISTENSAMAGTLYIDGSAHPFVNGDVNLTLGPGEYNATMYVGNLLYNQQTINLTAGEYLPLSWYENLVTFSETGLPNSVGWWVNLSHQSYSAASGKTIQFYASNGTYQYTVATSNKDYSITPSSSDFKAGGRTTDVVVKFSPVLYDITFSESGLATGVSWTVSHGTTSNSSTSSSMNFLEMNGTYSFSPSNLSAYYTENYSLSVSVNGQNTQVTVYYDHYAYITGTISPSGASVFVDGKKVAVNNGQFNVSVTAGKYSVVVSDSGYTTNETNISLVSGQVKNLQISLNKPGGGSLIEYAAIAGIGVVAAGAGTFFLARRKR